MSYPKPTFVEPATYGYIYVGITVDPPRHAPFVRRSRQRDDVLDSCAKVVDRLQELPPVVRAKVFEADFIIPDKSAPRFDVLVLIETVSLDAVSTVQNSDAYKDLAPSFVMVARNAKRIGDIDQYDDGTFLFNHFMIDDPATAPKAFAEFEDLTAWYTHKLGVDNTALLQPVDGAPWVFVNNVRVSSGSLRFLLNQILRPSFHRFVRGILARNGLHALPVLYKPSAPSADRKAP